MFTESNYPFNTVGNYVPKASFNITISCPKRHFFLGFAQSFLLYSECYDSCMLLLTFFFFYQITNINRRVLTVTIFILCFYNYVTSNKQAN